MHSLTHRHRVAELMDEPGLDRVAHEHALAGLARINALSLSARQLWKAIAVSAAGAKQVRVLDLGCGSGDMTLGVWRLGRGRGVRVDGLGLDLSPLAVERARQRAARQSAPVRFEVADVRNGDLPSDYDVVMCSLFLHHFSHDEATSLIRRMAGAARGLVLIDDLVRSRTGWALACTVPRLVTRSRVVHVDARRSVRAAFTAAEVLQLARTAGLRDPTVRSHFPSRLLMTGTPS